MNMKSSILNILSALLLAVSLCACSRSVQEYRKGVAVSAAFSDDEDRESLVSDLHLWFYDAGSGEMILHSAYESAGELALQIYSIPEGDYTVVLGANISVPISFDGENSPSELNYTLEGVSPVQAFSACADFNVGTLTRVIELRMDMKRFLCELAVEVEGSPDGLEIEIEAVNSASSFYPATKDGNGSYGIPSESVRPTSIPPFSLSSAATRSQTFILMPTALGREWSFWRIVMKTPEGKILESYIEAPRMNPGGKYLISLEYAQIQSFMHLSPCTIEDWTQGWVYNGVITDPTTTNE